MSVFKSNVYQCVQDCINANGYKANQKEIEKAIEIISQTGIEWWEQKHEEDPSKYPWPLFFFSEKHKKVVMNYTNEKFGNENNLTENNKDENETECIGDIDTFNITFLDMESLSTIDHNKISFGVEKSTKMAYLKNLYAESVGVPTFNLAFLSDGRRILDTDTTETIKMEQSDLLGEPIIEVFRRQI